MRKGGPFRVLVAEDHPVHQLLERAILEGLGCKVTMVADGLEAIQAARTEAFDLILLDRNMPRCDGDTAAVAIRQGPGASFEAPVACCSTALPQGDVVAIYDHILPKPLTPTSMWGVLDELIRGQAA